MNHSVNIRNMVAKRARICAAKPHLSFDYDQRNNCEAFANLMTGVAAKDLLGVQEGETPCCITCICCLINCLKIYRPRHRSLQKVVDMRLKKAADDGELV
jgi:hypothetical protein